MKTNLFTTAIFLCLSMMLRAQVPVDPDTKLITYQDVVTEEGNKDTLYNRAIEWINTYFKNPNEVTRIRDKENGKIMGQYRVRMMDKDEEGNPLNSTVIVEYTFRIELKEGKYRYTINDFEMKAASKYPLERWLDKTDPTYNPIYEEYMSQVDLHIKDLIASMKKGMVKKVVKDDNW